MWLIVFFLWETALAWEHESWLNEVESRVDNEAIAWLRKQINPSQKIQSPLPDFLSDCSSCHKGKILEIEEPKLFVFMSFSVPEAIWCSLSQEMRNHQAVFVLRGIPENSFKTLARKIGHLKEKGMESVVQIHPGLFKEYAVQSVPTFVYVNSGSSRKVSGAISIHYALSLIDQESEKRPQPLSEAGAGLK